MARQAAVTKNKQQLMADEKNAEPKGKPTGLTPHHATSNNSLSDPETRAKATMKDIDDLYTALQGLVPKPTPSTERRTTRSKTDSDTSKEGNDSFPGLRRRYHSESNVNHNKMGVNIDIEVKDVPPGIGSDDHLEMSDNDRVMTDHRRAMSMDCLVDSDSDLSTIVSKAKLQRVKSLPAYPEETENENETPKKSRFLLFRRRRRPKPKTKTTKKLNWRALLSTLSFRSSSTKNHKKKQSKNKVADGGNQTEQLHPTLEENVQKSTPTVRRAITDTVRKLPLTQEPTTRRATTDVVRKTPLTERRPTPTTVKTPLTKKRAAPEPPVVIPETGAGGRKNTMETKTDEVHKKLSAWYKYAVKETNYDSPAVRARCHKSCESLLTDTEILHARNAFSSDTDTPESLENLRKVRVRKTRANRNRRKERARWRSLPNVKLVFLALKKTEEKQPDAGETPESCGVEKELPEVPVSVKHATSVSPLEAKISFGNSWEEETTNEEPMTDFMNIQKDNNSRWVSRQCSKTSVSYIRPLKLSLFYSESPSRETVYRSPNVYAPQRLWFTGNPDINTDSGTTNGLVLKLARRDSGRRHKRRSFKRQLRLPQQSPFYFPTGASVTSKFFFGSSKEDSKDSGLGSPDPSEEKGFGMTSAGKRKHSEERGKMNWESEDSGWTSRDNRLTVKVEHGLQTGPVGSPVTTGVTVVPHSRLPRVINVLHDNGQSET